MKPKLVFLSELRTEIKSSSGYLNKLEKTARLEKEQSKTILNNAAGEKRVARSLKKSHFIVPGPLRLAGRCSWQRQRTRPETGTKAPRAVPLGSDTASPPSGPPGGVDGAQDGFPRDSFLLCATTYLSLIFLLNIFSPNGIFVTLNLPSLLS